ncbi:MAG: DUF3526 domain-containing protein [Myxococcota bacterium]
MTLFFRLEISTWLRDRRQMTLIVITLLGLIGVTVWATAGDLARRDAEHVATREARVQWESKGPANPHSMAHFGDFAFRPGGALARLDRGVQARLGKVLFLEGHRQGTPLHSDSDKAGALARFGRFDAAFVLQIVIPLLLVFLGSTGLAADREAGRLKLSLVQGAPASAILSGRLFALWGLGVACTVAVGLASFLTSAFLDGRANLALGRLLALTAAYALFFAVVSAAVIAVSVWVRRAGSALVALLAIWVMATAVLPRGTSSTAASLFPLPSQDAFQAELKAARATGPDGHNPEDVALAKLERETLEKHQVDTVEALPFNFDGLRMQLDEEFGNQVWDEHYGELRQQILRQQAVATLAAVANPFQAIEAISMALAGTDVAHDFAFQEQAERHRREMIEKLNLEHAYGGSKTGDWKWKASAEFLAGVGAFEYEAPSVADAIRSRWVEIVSLLLWLTLIGAAVFRGAARVEDGSLPC